jgi:hypothetical protein
MSAEDDGSVCIDLSAKFAEQENSPTRDRVSGRISIDLSSDEMDEVREIARKRNQSYQDGRTADTNYTADKALEAHIKGVTAELALELLYNEAELDRSISETGDDGVDCQLRIDGQLHDVDVKATKYENAWLLVKRGFDHEEADIYVTTYVDENHVEIVGFAWDEDILQEDNLEESPSPYQNHLNYTMRKGFEPMPEPDLADERVSF